MRERWTDDRLDDLNKKVDGLAARVDAGFEGLRVEMGKTNARLDAMQRTMIQFAGAIIAALAGILVAQVGLIVTQL